MTAQLAPIRLFTPLPAEPAEQYALDRERARLELVLGEIGPYGLSDRHARDLSGLGLDAVEAIQKRLHAAVMLAVGIEDVEAEATRHAMACADCHRWRLLFRATRVRCCRRARELARMLDRLERDYRRAVGRVR